MSLLSARTGTCRIHFKSGSSCFAGSRLAVRSQQRFLSTDRVPIAHSGSSRRVAAHRLFLAGLNPFLPSHARHVSAPVFREVPLDEWISSVSGRGAGIASRSFGANEISKQDIEITHISSGLGHALIAYRDKRTGQEKIFAIGRNDSGQLGLGYNSQEPTRGMVEGFEGDSIEDIKCGITSSYIQVRQGDKSVLYVCGNQYRGQLGIPAMESHSGPTQAFLSTATLVDLPSQSVKQIACGYEYLLVLTEQGLVLGTGINTDGQLGTSDDDDRHILSPVAVPQELVGAIGRVEAGADTSAFLTSNGQLWSFGNSEYAQAGHGRKIDRIMSPLQVKHPEGGTFTRVQIAGSSSIMLDNAAILVLIRASLAGADVGCVYAAGFGALGLGPDILSGEALTRNPGLEGVSAIYAGHGCCAAIDGNNSLFVFGLNSPSGRLGVGSSMNVHKPQKIAKLVRDRHSDDFDIADVVIGQQTCMVHVRDYGE